MAQEPNGVVLTASTFFHQSQRIRSTETARNTHEEAAPTVVSTCSLDTADGDGVPEGAFNINLRTDTPSAGKPSTRDSDDDDERFTCKCESVCKPSTGSSAYDIRVTSATSQSSSVVGRAPLGNVRVDKSPDLFVANEPHTVQAETATSPVPDPSTRTSAQHVWEHVASWLYREELEAISTLNLGGLVASSTSSGGQDVRRPTLSSHTSPKHCGTQQTTIFFVQGDSSVLPDSHVAVVVNPGRSDSSDGGAEIVLESDSETSSESSSSDVVISRYLPPLFNTSYMTVTNADCRNTLSGSAVAPETAADESSEVSVDDDETDLDSDFTATTS